MAVAIIEFTEERRERLAKFLGVAHWFCIIPSLLCLVIALYIQLTIQDKIKFIEDYNGHVLPGFLVSTGFFGIFSHILCGKVTFTSGRPDKRKKWYKFLLPAVIVTTLIFLLEFISGIMCFVHISNLEDSFDNGIRVAMAAYKDNIKMKEDVDVLQLAYECCGSKTYKDWFYITWIHPNYEGLTKRQPNGHVSLGAGFINDNVPFSCCSQEVLRPCINSHVNDNDMHYNYDYRSKTTLNNVGCTDKLMETYENSVLSVAGGIVLCLSFIQLVAAAFGRLLQTSIENAMSSDDEEGPSIGYIFNSGTTKRSAGLNDTVTTETSEGEPLLDSTFETTQSNEFTEQPDPTYQNVPPFEMDEEHIYNEGDVDRYLEEQERNVAGNNGYYDTEFNQEPEDPIYDVINPGLQRVNSTNRPSMTKVRSNHGSYMAMNFSNSSMHYAGKRKSKGQGHFSSPIFRHTRPSPLPEYGSERRPHVIDMAGNVNQSSEPCVPRKWNPSGPPWHSSPNRDTFSRQRKEHLTPYPSVQRRYVRGRFRPDKNLILESPQRMMHEAPKAHRRKSAQTYKTMRKMTLSPIHWENTSCKEAYYSNRSPYDINNKRSPMKGLAYQTHTIVPSMPMSAEISGRRNGSVSPNKRNRSPRKTISPEKISFRSGISYGCNHALD